MLASHYCHGNAQETVQMQKVNNNNNICIYNSEGGVVFDRDKLLVWRYPPTEDDYSNIVDLKKQNTDFWLVPLQPWATSAQS